MALADINAMTQHVLSMFRKAVCPLNIVRRVRCKSSNSRTLNFKSQYPNSHIKIYYNSHIDYNDQFLFKCPDTRIYLTISTFTWRIIMIITINIHTKIRILGLFGNWFRTCPAIGTFTFYASSRWSARTIYTIKILE